MQRSVTSFTPEILSCPTGLYVTGQVWMSKKCQCLVFQFFTEWSVVFILCSVGIANPMRRSVSSQNRHQRYLSHPMRTGCHPTCSLGRHPTMKEAELVRPIGWIASESRSVCFLFLLLSSSMLNVSHRRRRIPRHTHVRSDHVPFIPRQRQDKGRVHSHLLTWILPPIVLQPPLNGSAR